MRLAWFSPMPPVPSGIAACSAQLVSALTPEHHIDVFVDEPVAKMAAALGDGSAPLRSAHEFLWRHRANPYDLTVYQVGNSSHHDFLWPYLVRFPGLAVLHDAHLHHARAAALLRTKRSADYRAELVANHPSISPDLAELAIAGFDNHLYYSWPMTRLVVQASRMTAVHTSSLAAALTADTPGARVESIRLGHGQLTMDAEVAAARRRVRSTRRIADEAVLFGVFGGLTPEKRVPQVLDALESIIPYAPGAHLLLAGTPASHYDVAADVRRRGLEARVTMTGYLETESELTECIAACDVALSLRWPTAREISGPWLRALAAGRPTVTMDLEHLSHVPSLDPRTWTLNRGGNRGSGIRGAGLGIRDSGLGIGAKTRGGTGDQETRRAIRAHEISLFRDLLPSGFGNRDSRNETQEAGSGKRGADPVTIAVDIMDEDHSLRLAMRRLASDPELRAKLGAAGRAYWQQEHSPEGMIDDYRLALEAAAASPVPRPALPAHLVNDGDGLLKALLADFGLGHTMSSAARPDGRSSGEETHPVR
jgi:glycosyltransferase involved in cell wall biosynthesis